PSGEEARGWPSDDRGGRPGGWEGTAGPPAAGPLARPIRRRRRGPAGGHLTTRLARREVDALGRRLGRLLLRLLSLRLLSSRIALSGLALPFLRRAGRPGGPCGLVAH